MEACVGAHHLSGKLQALGHDARPMPAKYVRPYSKGQKNDFRDAEAIAEAVQRPTMNYRSQRCLTHRERVPPQVLAIELDQVEGIEEHACVMTPVRMRSNEGTRVNQWITFFQIELAE